MPVRAYEETPDGVTTNLRPGARARLRPRSGGDVLDTALAGRVAVIESVEQDDRGTVHVAVVLEDDPGRDLAATRHPAHRFFFAPDELEVLEPGAHTESRRVLVAGIGNIFLGDDGFGTAVARRLADLDLPPGVEVTDFGIRGWDLAYALTQPYSAAILVDLVPPRDGPGRLHVLAPEVEDEPGMCLDGHRMDPAAVLRLARRLGGWPPQVFLVGCEPGERAAEEDLSLRLSAPVTAAVERAAQVVRELAGRLHAGPVTDLPRETQEKGVPT